MIWPIRCQGMSRHVGMLVRKTYRERKKQMILDAGPVCERAFWKSKAADCGFRMFLLCISDVSVIYSAVAEEE